MRQDTGGMPARRAIVRWAWRLFRKEWRQQLLVVALITVAVAASVAGAAAAYNAPSSSDAVFGSANEGIRLDGADPKVLAANLAAARQAFGVIEVIGHRSAPVPGTHDSVDIRAQAPGGVYSASTLAVRAGRYPSGADEIAVTDDVAATFGVALGEQIDLGGGARTVVGIVENPEDLGDEFALVAPDGAGDPQSATVLERADDAAFAEFHDKAKGDVGRTIRGHVEQRTAALLALAAATIVLLLVSLVAAAGFAAVAQRRLRQLGMLTAIGATEKHLRLVVVADGILVGLVAAVAGTVTGLLAWLALAPRMETAVGHRIDRFDLPWWLVAAGVVLAVVTATAAAWWPARSMARVPVLSALSARPPRPQPAHRSALVALVLLAVGTGLIVYGDQQRALPIMVGIVALGLGLLFISPLAIRAIAALGGRLPVAGRVALRDLSRYQARSGAALAAISLGLAIPVTIVIVASAAQYSASQGNLSARQIRFDLGDGLTVPVTSAAELGALRAQVDDFAATLDRPRIVPLEGAASPADHETAGGRTVQPALTLGRRVGNHTLRDASTLRDAGTIYVATPDLLDYLGIDPSAADAGADVLTAETGVLSFVNTSSRAVTAPKLVAIADPGYSSIPGSLITESGLARGGWQPITVGWLVESSTPLTSAQRAAARHVAAAAGLATEVRDDQARLTKIRTGATIAGLLLALGVLAMTVGLLRAEAAGELRTLTATGATSAVRRGITATTAGALAFLGVVLGTASAYLGLVAGYASDLGHLHRVPFAELTVIGVGLPLAAAAAGWLLAGREPPMLTRAALE